MRAAAYICSTATACLRFVEYDKSHPGEARPPRELRSVAIMGGANLPPKTLVTPKGVLTPVSADELSFLVANDSFNKGVKRGFLTIIRGESDMDAALSGMESKDRSAPKTPADYTKPPTVGAVAA